VQKCSTDEGWNKDSSGNGSSQPSMRNALKLQPALQSYRFFVELCVDSTLLRQHHCSNLELKPHKKACAVDDGPLILASVLCLCVHVHMRVGLINTMKLGGDSCQTPATGTDGYKQAHANSGPKPTWSECCLRLLSSSSSQRLVAACLLGLRC